MFRVTYCGFVLPGRAGSAGKGGGNMHMADALLSPTVGGAIWAVSAGGIAWCSARLRREQDDRQAPLMGVLGAFLFAAQMINFTIPGTGSSGHLTGGLLLAILLGPTAAFLTVASVLMVQALFFADGGLLALGCNIFNLALIPALVVFPLFYRRFVGSAPGRFRQWAVTMTASVIAMQLGAFAVVLETVASGVSSLPFSRFLLLMQPIHLAIGLVEGGVTVAVVSFVRKARPELLQQALGVPAVATRSRASICAVFLAAAVITAGGLSRIASEQPDGLEWSVARVTGQAEPEGAQQGVHGLLAALQEKSARLRDYSLDSPRSAVDPPRSSAAAGDAGASALPGLVGAMLTLLLVFFAGMLLKKTSRPAVAPEG